MRLNCATPTAVPWPRRGLRDPVCALTRAPRPRRLALARHRLRPRTARSSTRPTGPGSRCRPTRPEVRMPTDAEFDARLTGKRPRIFFTEVGFDRLRERINSDHETRQLVGRGDVARRVWLRRSSRSGEPADVGPGQEARPDRVERRVGPHLHARQAGERRDAPLRPRLARDRRAEVPGPGQASGRSRWPRGTRSAGRPTAAATRATTKPGCPSSNA